MDEVTVDVEIDNLNDLMRLRPIKPTMSLMDERREILDKIIKLQMKDKRLCKDTIKLEKLQKQLDNVEFMILSSKK